MSFYNGILNHDDEISTGKGERGLPGVGFRLDDNNNYDMQNEKLVNVKNGENNQDVVTKNNNEMINRGYYMAARRYKISLGVLKKYFTRSLRSLVKYFFNTRREISYLQAVM